MGHDYCTPSEGKDLHLWNRSCLSLSRGFVFSLDNSVEKKYENLKQ